MSEQSAFSLYNKTTKSRSEVEAEAVPAVLPGTEPCTGADAEVDC